MGWNKVPYCSISRTPEDFKDLAEDIQPPKKTLQLAFISADTQFLNQFKFSTSAVLYILQ